MADPRNNPRYVEIELRPAPFEGKKNAFIQPSKPLITPTLKREVPIAKSLAELGQLPNVSVEVCKPVKEGTAKRKSIANKVAAPAPIAKVSNKPVFTQAHVLSDEMFIVITRSMNVHDKGGKALFFANGGGDIIAQYDTLAFAWEALRRQKITKIAGVKAAAYKRHNQIDLSNSQVYVSPLHADPNVRARAIETAKLRQDNAHWLSSALPKAKRI